MVTSSWWAGCPQVLGGVGVGLVAASTGVWGVPKMGELLAQAEQIDPAADSTGGP